VTEYGGLRQVPEIEPSGASDELPVEPICWFGPSPSGRTVDELLEFLAGEAAVIMRADRSSIFLLDRATNELWSRVALGVGNRVIRMPAGGGIVGHVVATGELLNVSDVYQDPRFHRGVDRQTGYVTRSILCAPMRNGDGRIIGALQVLNKMDGGPFSSDDEGLASVLAAQCAAAISAAQGASTGSVAAANGERAGPRLGAPIVMFVHQNEAADDAAAELLGAEFRVVRACGAAEAIDAAERERPDLCLLAVDGQDEDAQTCRTLRASVALGQTPILVMSSSNRAEDAVGAFEAGANDYIVKPFSPAQLRAKTQTWLLRSSRRA